jgi:hypothetical protein
LIFVALIIEATKKKIGSKKALKIQGFFDISILNLMRLE